ncbi:uncharacterized protein K460DRAFT_3556 [Cucurbitaria berberidis CBS 394.84]|uniref:Uncharacterized protein n=1 Tax=Cucurbitaria berberidis CBS 394.84 TaxID=1168544 RepID=A0A9P4GRI2_9PLEO|nr:uncharacterized protein K460DRAFT_3556 [Cucurbitaria berberidis CBS 394.84]KAF1849776.1 hypothetical protein K460DRAFT_3556 [Cucurbitaria berberidis CBS 394.84]
MLDWTGLDCMRRGSVVTWPAMPSSARALVRHTRHARHPRLGSVVWGYISVGSRRRGSFPCHCQGPSDCLPSGRSCSMSPLSRRWRSLFAGSPRQIQAANALPSSAALFCHAFELANAIMSMFKGTCFCLELSSWAEKAKNIGIPIDAARAAWVHCNGFVPPACTRLVYWPRQLPSVSPSVPGRGYVECKRRDICCICMVNAGTARNKEQDTAAATNSPTRRTV